LDDETVIRFDADLRIAGGVIEAIQVTAHIEEADHFIWEPFEKLTFFLLVLVGYIPFQYDHII
ncbi:hypothetical protein, partial [Bifidobacterium adolescentis]|uniref:hypothetical protein n=1 Tax=Bifidobacterium adolescentis TaxID=1680 RepID=UPI00210E960C